MFQSQLSLAAPSKQHIPTVLFFSLLAGLVIGVLTIVLQKLLPNSVVQLANSAAV